MQNEEVANKQWGSDSFKKGLFLGGNNLHLLPIAPSHFQASDLWTSFPRQKRVQTDSEVTFKTKFKVNYFIQTPATHPLPSSLQKYSSSQADLRPKPASLEGISPLYMKLHSTQRCGRVGEKVSCSKTIL